MNASDIIAICSCAVTAGLSLYIAFSDRSQRRRESTDSRLNRSEDRLTALEAQVAVIVGGIQRIDARQERTEDLLFKTLRGKHGRHETEEELEP